MDQLIESLEGEHLKTNLPDFKVGDTVSVHYRIIEAPKGGKEGGKERIQIFTGIVIARKGKGISETASIYRIAYGSAMERIIPIHSPRVAKIEVVKQGSVNKGKLYHLRGEFGKKAKIKERIVKREEQVAKQPVAETPTPEQEPPSTEE